MPNMKNVLRVCSLLVVLLVAGLGQPLTSAAQDAFYGFGDSLSDTGNDFLFTTLIGFDPAIPPSGAYFQGRFSNGPVAFEYLWRLLKQNDSAAVRPILAGPGPNPTLKGGISFAFGGAESGVSNPVPGGFLVPGLLGQVEIFRDSLKGRKPRPHALYGVWAGANDYLSLSHPPTAPTVVVGNITSAIERLHALGARRFIVLNLPDLGSLPIVQEQGLEAVFTQLTGVHNALLAQSLDGLEAQLAGVKIVRIDVFALTQALAGGIVDPPALEFLTGDPGAPFCLFTNPATCPDVSSEFELVDPYIFWDAEHPTTLVHGLLGRAMFEALQQ
jgi:phospholipase/lecithinase/hemolysin